MPTNRGIAAGLLRGLVLSMIALTAVSATILAYSAFVRLLAGHWPAAGGPVLFGAGLALGSWLLCRHRDDLVYC